MRNFNKKEDSFILKNYKLIPLKQISRLIGRSESSARQRLKLLGYTVPPEIAQRFKEDSYIKKGTVPPNKGKKQIEYMTKEAIDKTVSTRFKKGGLPHNTKESDFTISIRADKRGIQYKFIRISIGKWVALARYNWEKVNGKIPSGMKIIHKDNDTLNCNLSNLELLTPGELMKRNSLHNYPKEIALTIQLTGALNRKINRKNRELNEKQN